MYNKYMDENILLVEDDMALAMGTEYALRSEGYNVLHAPRLAAARDVLDSDVSVSLVLLDVMLPDGSGYDFIKEIRSGGSFVPVIFLTAVSEEVNIVQGLDLGADDYITKPFGVKELLSRIAVQLRRVRREAEGASGPAEAAFGSHVLDIKNYRLYKDNRAVDMTPTEIRMLILMALNPGKIISRDDIISAIYDTESSFIDDNTLSVYIKRLRAKLGDDAGLIETVRGQGYRLKCN